MCGITGYKTFSDNSSELERSLQDAVSTLKLRGPDFQDVFVDKTVGLGHTRLSIIDTSSKAHQPMMDHSKRYTLIFNGEIYNFKELRKELDVELQSSSDTEVLLYLLIKEGKACLSKLNGFFAFAFYDSTEESLLIARDRMGIKPLHYYLNEDFLVFGSEMKSLLSYDIPRKINQTALYWYLRLTYLPYELSMIEGVRKLLPGHFMEVKGNQVRINSYWELEERPQFQQSYDRAKTEVVALFEQSVQRRMIADVPLGAFLSGGTDSSAVVSMASKFNSNLNTFSVGYKDHPFFDETNYAELVANRFKTNHITFSLTNEDLLNCVGDVVDYIDEPFADSSAIPTYILSKHVSASMKVALSGDGADELFGGYYKHLAFVKSEKNSFSNSLIKHLNKPLTAFPQSRSTSIGNAVRRLSKYSDLLRLPTKEKYWQLASFNDEANLLLSNALDQQAINDLEQRIDNSLFGLNQFLDTDLRLVLPGDMLTKVDLMSMANSLEVRVPFLDPDLVQFARSLPKDFKVKGNHRKRILQDAFEYILPKELHHRSKKGFEVPMLHWLRNELLAEIDEVVFNKDFLNSQDLFNSEIVLGFRYQLFSKNPSDVHAIIWSLYVFQKWYRRYFL